MGDNLDFLGDYKEVLLGDSYEEKIKNLMNCIRYAHEKGYSICERKECSVLLTAAWANLKGPLAEELEEVQAQLNHISQRKGQGRTLRELLEESKKDLS